MHDSFNPQVGNFQPALLGNFQPVLTAVFFDAIQAPAFLNDRQIDLMRVYVCVQRQDAVFFGLLDDWIVEWEGASFGERNAMYYTVRNRYNANSRSVTHGMVMNYDTNF